MPFEATVDKPIMYPLVSLNMNLAVPSRLVDPYASLAVIEKDALIPAEERVSPGPEIVVVFRLTDPACRLVVKGLPKMSFSCART
jgi:hypothetical protein